MVFESQLFPQMRPEVQTISRVASSQVKLVAMDSLPADTTNIRALIGFEQIVICGLFWCFGEDPHTNLTERFTADSAVN
jgi:hypothetical protein